MLLRIFIPPLYPRPPLQGLGLTFCVKDAHGRLRVREGWHELNVKVGRAQTPIFWDGHAAQAESPGTRLGVMKRPCATPFGVGFYRRFHIKPGATAVGLAREVIEFLRMANLQKVALRHGFAEVRLTRGPRSTFLSWGGGGGGGGS